MKLVLQVLEKLHSATAKKIATDGLKKQWGDANWETGRNKSLVSLSTPYWWSLLAIQLAKQIGFVEASPGIAERGSEGLPLQGSNF